MKTAIEGIYQCSRCRHFFTEEEMHSNNTGKFQVCKPCHNISESERRAANRDKQREYERQFYSRNSDIARERSRLNRLSSPEKLLAINKLNYAIRTGKIERKLCEVCGVPAHAHHDDYSKPLRVRWLCPLHHIRLHSKMKEVN